MTNGLLDSIIDMDTAPFEVIEALPDLIKDKMKSSEEYQGCIKHQLNVGTATRANRPKVAAERIAADEAETENLPL